MERVDLAARRRFSDEAPQKVSLFASDRLLFDQHCLRPGQSQAVHTHEREDKAYLVLEGEALFEIDGERELVPEGGAVFARAGSPHGVANESDSDLVLLVAMAPSPSR